MAPGRHRRVRSRTGVSLDLALDDEARTSDRLRANEVLAAVTTIRSRFKGCKTIPPGAVRCAACATPAFVDRYFAEGMNAESLARAPHMRFGRHDAMQERWAREAHGIDRAGPVHQVPSTYGLLDFILAGIGGASTQCSWPRGIWRQGGSSNSRPRIAST